MVPNVDGGCPETREPPFYACIRTTIAQASHALCGMRAINIRIVRKSCRGKGIASRLSEKRGCTDFAPIWVRPRPWQHPITTQLQNQLTNTKLFSKPLATPFVRKPHMARKYSKVRI